MCTISSLHGIMLSSPCAAQTEPRRLASTCKSSCAHILTPQSLSAHFSSCCFILLACLHSGISQWDSNGAPPRYLSSTHLSARVGGLNPRWNQVHAQTSPQDFKISQKGTWYEQHLCRAHLLARALVIHPPRCTSFSALSSAAVLIIVCTEGGRVRETAHRQVALVPS